METDVILLLLRIASGLGLLSLTLTVTLVIWREYRTTIEQLEANRRVYGQLVALQEIDGNYMVMGQTFPLRPVTTLGRAPTNHIVINDSFASSEHAQIVLRNGQWWLEDRRSRNGTSLNELPISGPTVMTDGDVIGIGQRRYRLDLER
jgi:hypothetical protein